MRDCTLAFAEVNTQFLHPSDGRGHFIKGKTRDEASLIL